MSNVDDCKKFLSFIEKYFIETENKSEKTQIISKSANIKYIFIYPIKSCGSFEVNDWEFGSRGLLFDREWALIDCKTNRALSAKNNSLMITLKPILDIKNNKLIVNAPNKDPLIISLLDDDQSLEIIQMRVCGDSCSAISYSNDVDQWFSDYLGKSCRLVRTIIDKPRSCKIDEIKKSESKLKGIDENQISCSKSPNQISQVSFANESQLLVINEASVEELRNRISPDYFSETLKDTIMRFRANIVLNNINPYEEDDWNTLHSTKSVFNVCFYYLKFIF